MSDNQRKRRFWLYFVLFILGMLVSFYSGYQAGYEVAKSERTNKSPEKITQGLFN